MGRGGGGGGGAITHSANVCQSLACAVALNKDANTMYTHTCIYSVHIHCIYTKTVVSI